MKKYEVTNITNTEKKFRDGWLGKDIIVAPKKTVITIKPPKADNNWKVKIHTEKTEEIYSRREVSKKDGKNKNA